MKVKIGKHTITITKADKRDFIILLVASLLNLSFAAEKLFIICGNQQPDWVWFCVYGGIGVFLTYIAVVDFIHDEIEEEKHEGSRII